MMKLSSNSLTTWCEELTLEKTLILGKAGDKRRSGPQRMRWLNGITNSTDMSEQTPGDSERQGSLVCHSLWGHKESDTT